jgi:hypothetical protein
MKKPSTHTQQAAAAIHTRSNRPNHTKAHAALVFLDLHVRPPKPVHTNHSRTNRRTARKKENHNTQHVVNRIWHLVEFIAGSVYSVERNGKTSDF